MKAVNTFITPLLILLILPSISWAAGASGSFQAEKACEAYQSKNKKTNPGDFRLERGTSYGIVEVNKAQDPSWYKVEIASANPKERWVKASCGKAVDLVIASGGGVKDPKCQTAGLEDSYVFAVSWQPAFCEGHRDKPECAVTDPGSFQAKHFTLHGLWPNKQSCGKDYGFCGKYKEEVRPFCKFGKVPMSEETLNKLDDLMPGAAYGSCLQRHEWYKHGTCQTDWNADGYFDHAMRLLAEFNGTGERGLSSFMVKNLGRKVSIDELNAEIDKQFGEGAHRRMQYTCNRENKLQDIYISLPAEIENKSLNELIQQAPEKYLNKCSDSFVVDPIGY